MSKLNFKLPEIARLDEARKNKKKWKMWGPYLTERQWGTVREDYSIDGNAWKYITHDMARSKAYRWGEEGIFGISDDRQFLCFGLSLWNTKDNILKERFFGLDGHEGNHGEDVKEIYYYLDSSPTHSYMKALYKYPQSRFPYEKLVEENARRGKEQGEYELIDTGIFDEKKYFDVTVEYAKADVEDILVKITAVNRGPDPATIHLLPTIWFRNNWRIQRHLKPSIQENTSKHHLELTSSMLGKMYLHYDTPNEVLVTENETNKARLYGQDLKGFFKDGINDYVVGGAKQAINPEGKGSKAAPHYIRELKPQEEVVIKLRLSHHAEPMWKNFDTIFSARILENNEYYEEIQKGHVLEDAKHVQRQAFAGMLWAKQFYHYDINEWVEGDPGQPAPPASRQTGRNHEWNHFDCADIISMPDKWEYPWFAAWDLAFHTIPLAMLDPDFAKEQLVLLTKENYMHPSGQLPAYEWAFGDVNPPVHAWATFRVFKIEEKILGVGDLDFLERMLHKLMINFTWWVNRKDESGRNIFQGGFLGLDNIGVFDRSKPLPTGGTIEQSDGTSWMAMYALNLMRIALEIAVHRPVYQDIATKFFEHFMRIAEAMTSLGAEKTDLWNEEDGFYYDVLVLPDGTRLPFKIQSMVGFVPLFAVEILDDTLLNKVPEFKKRLEYFFKNRPHLTSLVSRWNDPGKGETHLFSLLRGSRMKKLLRRMLDEEQFLSPYGIRALSKVHKEKPYLFEHKDTVHTVSYQPGESDSGLFGGNSNWRGPVWFPMNFLIIESLQRFYHYYGDDFKIEFPVGSGNMITILEASQEISKRCCELFLRDEKGNRAIFGDDVRLQEDPEFKDHILFHEYFHGDTGKGLGASHQTGWTGLVAKLLQPWKGK